MEWLVSKPVLDQEEMRSFANATFKSSMDEVYYTYQVRGNPDALLYRAELAGLGFAGGKPLRLGSAASTVVASPAVSLSGNELWFGAAGDASLDVFVSAGAGVTWDAATPVAELSSDYDDAPRPPGGPEANIMPLSSKRHGGKQYQIYFATRVSAADPWQSPTQEHLATINSADSESVDGFLSDDGLTLYFSSTRLSGDIKGDLFRAHRASADDDFGEPEYVPDVNSPNDDERDPWLAPGGKRLFFSSNRSGEYAIYSAESLK
jgi:hypothetical protein